MKSLYSTRTFNVPEDYAKPSKSFKKHVWIAILGLLLFIGTYLFLTVWFGYQGVRLFNDFLNESGNGIFNFMVGVGFIFLSIFMIKSLFFIGKKEKDENSLKPQELNKKDEPVLFDYLYQLADEAGAPRPNKVILTSRVNASVYYDISIWNLIFPTKKNLEIGLGLVNVLNLGELKAVLAHEFGHFAQRSMLLGRYVYVAQQVASRIIAKRDFLDQFLSGLSYSDIRIAWIGWILSIMVWSIRALIEILFSVVVVSERALSREMEFQADLVAASLTGSDALVHALHKLRAADHGYHGALATMNELLGEKKAVPDMFSLQSNYIKNMGDILNDPSYGESPSVPTGFPEKNRIFVNTSVNPPQMWATHPPDDERENNLKNSYIKADIDSGSSWQLFSNHEELRKKITADLVKSTGAETTLITEEEAIASQNKVDFDWTFLNKRYYGNYFKRNVFVNFETPEQLYDESILSSDLKVDFQKIYPKELGEIVDEYNQVLEDVHSLTLVKNERITAEKRTIYHRGNQVKRREIPTILEELKKEEDKLRQRLMEHDKLCRTVHYKAASTINKELSDNLLKLSTLVHFAEHSYANMNDANNKLGNVLSIAFADGNVSNDELTQVIIACNDLHKVLREIYANKENIQLPESLLKKLEVKDVAELFGEFEYPMADANNINEWLNHIESWIIYFQNILSSLRAVSLEKLLEKEAEIKTAYTENSQLSIVSESMNVPNGYATLVPGNERQIQYKLNLWDSFHANDGIVASVAKFAVSVLLVGGAIFGGIYGREIPSYKLWVYNDLETEVYSEIGNETVRLTPGEHQFIEVETTDGDKIEVITKTKAGKSIEHFNLSLDRKKEVVYNIGGAGVFVAYTVVYGSKIHQPQQRYIIGKRLFTTRADYVFTNAPEQLYVKSGGRKVKSVLESLKGLSSEQLLSIIEDDSIRLLDAAKHHLKWDKSESEGLMEWMHIASELSGNVIEVLESRLKNYPNELVTMRAMQNYSEGELHHRICENHTKLSQESPDNSDLFYLKARCIEDELAQKQAFLEGYKKWPKHPWLAYAASQELIEENKWEQAYSALITARNENKHLKEQLVLDIERVKRMRQKDNVDVSSYLTDKNESDALNAIKQLETGFLKNSPQHIYYLLSQGKFVNPKNYGDVGKDAHWLMAASDNYPEKKVNQLLEKQNIEGATDGGLWAAIGIYAKYDKDITSFESRFGKNSEVFEKVKKYIGLVRKGELKKAEKLIEEYHFSIKAKYFVIGKILLGKKTPQKWNDYIKYLLFVYEKPYFEDLK